MEAHLKDWNLFSSWNSDENFTKQDLDSDDQLIFEVIKNFLKNKCKIKKNSKIIVLDGAKKTILVPDCVNVLKIYPKSARSVYNIEKKNYEIIKKNNLLQYFVPHTNFQDKNLTCISKKVIPYPNPPDKIINEILSKLADKNLTLGDVQYGDNVGKYKGSFVVYDIKSLKKL